MKNINNPVKIFSGIFAKQVCMELNIAESLIKKSARPFSYCLPLSEYRQQLGQSKNRILFWNSMVAHNPVAAGHVAVCEITRPLAQAAAIVVLAISSVEEAQLDGSDAMALDAAVELVHQAKRSLMLQALA